MTNRTIRTLGSLVVLAIVIAALHFASRFGLRGPTGMSADELRTWVNDPVTALATVARWIALGLSYYLFVVVAAIGFFADEDELPSGLRRFIPGGLASTLGVALGLAVPLASGVAHAVAVDAPMSDDRPETLRLAAVDESPLVLSETGGSGASSGQPHHLLTPEIARVPGEDLWQVESGNSFWSIAREMIIDHAEGASEPDDETIAAYWRVLIEANRDRLIEPGNPDLIMPGQELVLPPISHELAE